MGFLYQSGLQFPSLSRLNDTEYLCIRQYEIYKTFIIIKTMEKHSITAKLKGGKAFEALVSGHKVTVDSESDTSQGPSPRKLMLLALAGCTGMDVVSILQKMKVELNDLNITVEGELMDEHPRYYKTMHVIYEFTGYELPADKLERAVELSEEKYCSVRALYSKAIKVTSEIRIINSIRK